jgi:hypothetical protein
MAIAMQTVFTAMALANPFMPRLDNISYYLEAGVVTRLAEPGW